MSDALGAFDSVIADREELAPFALYFKALALAHVGDMERAEALLTGEAEGPIGLSRRGVIAHVSILSQLGRMQEALALTDAMFGANPDEDVAYLRAALEDGRAMPFDTITSAQDGMAETYFMLASALPSERGDWLPLIYARLTLALRPDHGDAILLAGQLLERAGQYGWPDAVYDTMSADHPQYLGAQLGKANALARSGESTEAIDSLRACRRPNPTPFWFSARWGTCCAAKSNSQRPKRPMPARWTCWTRSRNASLGADLHPRHHAGAVGRMGARRTGIPPRAGLRSG